MRFYLLLSTFWTSGIMIAGCNSSHNDSIEHNVKTYIVEIRQMKFVPEQIEVQSGDSIQWVNKDIVVHNVTGETSDAWASPDLKTGESFITEVNTAGSYKCSLHPVMKGKISLIDD